MKAKVFFLLMTSFAESGSIPFLFDVLYQQQRLSCWSVRSLLLMLSACLMARNSSLSVTIRLSSFCGEEMTYWGLPVFVKRLSAILAA